MNKKVLIGVGLALVVISITATTIYRNARPAVASINGTQVTRGSIGEEVFASGKLELNNKTEVNAPFTAKVKSVSVKLGDQVQPGQVLFEMETKDLQKQLDNAKLDLAGAKAGLNETNTTRTRKIADAKRSLEDAQSKRDQAAAALQAVDKTTDPAAYLKAEVEYETAKQAYEQAKNAYASLINTPAGNSQLENNIKKLQASVTDLQNQINSAVVKAPVAGTVVNLNAVAGSGQAAATGSSPMSLEGLGSGTAGGLGNGPLVTIATLDKLKARVKVNEIDSTKVQAGQKAKITCEAVGKDFTGSVDSVAPTAVTSSGTRGEETTVEVVITLDNSTGLKPGYNINAAIEISSKANALLVPIEAVTDRNSKKVLFVAENDTVKLREVSVGISGEQKLEITSGVKEGEQVILNPAPNLNEGDKVKINVQR